MNKDSVLEQIRKNEILVLTYAYDDEKYLLLAKEQLLRLCKTYLPENKIKIDEKDSLLEQVLALLVIARELSLPEDLDSRGNFEANLQALQKHQEEKERELKLLAEAELTKKGFVDPRKKILEIMNSLSHLDQDSEVLAYAAALDPTRTMSVMGEIVAPNYQNTTQLAIDLSPLLVSISELDPNINYVITQTESFLPTVSSPQNVSVPLATYKFINPTATENEYQKFIDQLIVSVEANTGKVVNVSQTVAQSVHNLKINQPPEQIIEKSIRLDLNKVGSSEQQIKDIIKIVPLLTTIASSVPSKSLDKKKVEQLAVFQNLMELTLSYYFPQRQSKSGLAANFTWAQAAMVYYQSQQTTQIYNQEYFQHNFGPTSKNPVLSFLFDQGTGYIKDEITKQAMAKFAASGLGKTLGLGAVETGAVAAGTAAALPTGGVSLLLTIAPFVIEIGKKFLSWGKINFKKIAIALGAAIGLLIAGPVGAVMGAAGGFVISSPGLSFTKATTSLGNAITAGSTAMVGLVATEIATPIILIAISIPIVIALLLFIINTSALVVPPNPNGFVSTGDASPFNPIVGTCPIQGGFITCGSYGTSTPACPQGHGGNSYWSNKTACGYSIPIGPSCQNNNNHTESVCYNSQSTCSTYGYAVDTSAPTLATTPVYLPKIDNLDLNWEFQNEYSINGGSWGYGRVYFAQNETNTYQIYLGHMKNGQKIVGGKSGTLVGTLFCLTNRNPCDGSHIHIELKKNGIDQIPDPLCR